MDTVANKYRVYRTKNTTKRQLSLENGSRRWSVILFTSDQGLMIVETKKLSVKDGSNLKVGSKVTVVNRFEGAVAELMFLTNSHSEALTFLTKKCKGSPSKANSKSDDVEEKKSKPVERKKKHDEKKKSGVLQEKKKGVEKKKSAVSRKDTFSIVGESKLQKVDISNITPTPPAPGINDDVNAELLQKILQQVNTTELTLALEAQQDCPARTATGSPTPASPAPKLYQSTRTPPRTPTPRQDHSTPTPPRTPTPRQDHSTPTPPRAPTPRQDDSTPTPPAAPTPRQDHSTPTPPRAPTPRQDHSTPTPPAAPTPRQDDSTPTPPAAPTPGLNQSIAEEFAETERRETFDQESGENAASDTNAMKEIVIANLEKLNQICRGEYSSWRHEEFMTRKSKRGNLMWHTQTGFLPEHEIDDLFEALDICSKPEKLKGPGNIFVWQQYRMVVLIPEIMFDVLKKRRSVEMQEDEDADLPTIYGPKERSTDVYDFQGDDSDTDSEAGLIRGERVEEDETEEEQTENETEEEQTENETEEEQTQNGLTITDSALLPSTAKLPEVIGSLNLLHKKLDKLIGLIQPTANVSSHGVSTTTRAARPSSHTRPSSPPRALGPSSPTRPSSPPRAPRPSSSTRAARPSSPTRPSSPPRAPRPSSPTRPSSATRAQHTRSATSSSPPIFNNNRIWNCTPAQLFTNNGQITKEHLDYISSKTSTPQPFTADYEIDASIIADTRVKFPLEEQVRDGVRYIFNQIFTLGECKNRNMTGKVPAGVESKGKLDQTKVAALTEAVRKLYGESAARKHVKVVVNRQLRYIFPEKLDKLSWFQAEL